MDRHRHHTPALRLRIIGLACLLVVVLLQACSTLTLGYNRAATLSYWWLDSQLDLTEAQSQQLRADLDELHRWHRREALPRYATLLQNWEQLAPHNITATQACEQFELARSLLLQIAHRGARPLAQLAQTVTPTQREHLQRQNAKDNKGFRDDFVDPPQSGLARRVKRLTERLETFYGPLDLTQRRLVQEHLGRGSFDGQLAMAERERRQADVLRTITAIQTSPAQGPALVQAAVWRAVESPSARYLAASRQWQREGCELIAAMHNSSSPAQRQQLIETLRSYTGDFTLLARQD